MLELQIRFPLHGMSLVVSLLAPIVLPSRAEAFRMKVLETIIGGVPPQAVDSPCSPG